MQAMKILTYIAGIGTLLVSSFVIWGLGIALYIFTFVLFMAKYGFGAGILSLCLPIISTIYAFFWIWTDAGTPMTPFGLTCLVYVGLWIVKIASFLIIVKAEES